MAKLSDKDVKHVALLANLDLTDDEVKTYQKQLSEVISYFDQINEVNTEGVDPTGQTTGLENVTRPDSIDPSRILTSEQALSTAENTHNGYVVVPLILKQKDE